MGQDRRLGIDRRSAGNRRIGIDNRGYLGPNRRNGNDRRSYIERRSEKHQFSESTPF